MSEMVERVARMIRPLVYGDDHAVAIARGIILAMREPTVAMECVKVLGYSDYEHVAQDDVWRAMIDEALR